MRQQGSSGLPSKPSALLSLLMLALLVAGCARAPSGDVVELVYATPYSPNHPFSRADQIWMQFVEQRSAGSLKIRPSWSGALLSAEHSMVELRHGVVDVGLITPIYVKGGTHLVRIQSGFYSGAESIEEQVALYRCMAGREPQFQQELLGLKILAVQGGNLPGLITRDRPVRSLADLNGMRIRAPTELLSVLRDLKADPVNMPMGEVYSALAKGVIDGVVAPTDTFRSMHFAEVARYYTPLVVPRGAYPARAMGEARWRSLTAEQQQVLEEAIPVWEHALADENRKSLAIGWAQAEKEGIERVPIAEGEQKTFDALYERDALRNAKQLQRYGIDGERVYRHARSSITADGQVRCAVESS